MKTVEKLRYWIVEDFGNGYAAFGHSDLMGRVVGLLLSETHPLSVDDISEKLHVSRSPINQICRRLEELKLIRKAWVQGNRKYHFVIQEDVFRQASINLSQLNEGNLQIAERNLERLQQLYSEAGPEEKKQLEIICGRLLLMRDFYRKLLQAYREFIAGWNNIRDHIPDAQEFLQQSIP